MTAVREAADADPAVVARVTSDLAALHAELGLVRRGVTYRHWVPRGARRQRRRLFVASVAGHRPVCVAKVPLDPADEKVEEEWAVLRSLPAGGPARTRPIARLARGWVMEWAPDHDLPDAVAALTDPAGLDPLLARCVELMLRLHTAAGAWQPPPARRASPLEIAHGFLGADLERAGPAALAALAGARTGPTHGDLGPWNIRCATGRDTLTLIDWEDYQPAGIQAIDLLNTVFTCALLIFPEYPRRGFEWLGEQVFHVAGPFRSVVANALRRYARGTGQSAVALAELLPVACLWLDRRIRNQGRDTSGMFYLPLMDHFLRTAPHWIGELDE
ncbi:phosphotransferase [Streptomyces varsoviensis]|nr:phosphotransferase [Streptomyces varsoviensis]